MEKEIWKPAKWFEDKFEVSNHGNIRKKGSSSLLKNKSSRYFLLTKTKKGKTKNFPLHRIIFETFVGEIPDGYIIHHIDENKKNNAVSNLLMVTAEEHVKIHFTGKPSWNKGLKTPKESHKKQWETRRKKYPTDERNKNIFNDKEKGLTLKELSAKYKLCARQILTICKSLKEQDKC